MLKLLQTANTFDILLFKNRTLISKVQRIFTNSDYDHVAMLIKSSHKEVYLFEATSNSGVAVFPLRALVDLGVKKLYMR